MKALNPFIAKGIVCPCNNALKLAGRINRFTGMLVLVLLLITGCSVLKPIESASSGREGALLQRRTSPVYHDFEDILVPGELRVDRRMSSVFQTETVSAGVLVFSGKMSMEALTQFFKKNMDKDNWRWVSGFKGTSSLLIFEKGNRWCVITMTGAGYGTQTRIWVAPKTN
jgi:hypothetical protein